MYHTQITHKVTTTTGNVVKHFVQCYLCQYEDQSVVLNLRIVMERLHRVKCYLVYNLKTQGSSHKTVKGVVKKLFSLHNSQLEHSKSIKQE